MLQAPEGESTAVPTNFMPKDVLPAAFVQTKLLPATFVLTPWLPRGGVLDVSAVGCPGGAYLMFTA